MRGNAENHFNASLKIMPTAASAGAASLVDKGTADVGRSNCRFSRLTDNFYGADFVGKNFGLTEHGCRARFEREAS
jgi:hypothetical protein